ncbi:hypothetical protein PVAP13_7NG077467 [Panicum virgatum]|uniref:Uncharacterized protein n=1 Tax=Panicum virgatum TaxID=38727 RepID=A0A8T0PQK0_PANVG|nr:hypothetical protein PVAP13_7NG077467 [Panicum virgatum]
MEEIVIIQFAFSSGLRRTFIDILLGQPFLSFAHAQRCKKKLHVLHCSTKQLSTSLQRLTGKNPKMTGPSHMAICQ